MGTKYNVSSNIAGWKIVRNSIFLLSNPLCYLTLCTLEVTSADVKSGRTWHFIKCQAWFFGKCISKGHLLTFLPHAKSSIIHAYSVYHLVQLIYLCKVGKNPLTGSWDISQTNALLLKSDNFSPALTLKIRSRSAKLNQYILQSQWYIYAKLVRLHTGSYLTDKCTKFDSFSWWS